MNSRLVYSTEFGRMCGKCKQSVAACSCRKTKQVERVNSQPGCPNDGTVRVRREVKGRKGKAATVITGLPLDEIDIKQFAKVLKQLCGSGGTVKDGLIIIQGDHRQTVLDVIKEKGYKVKLAGG